MQIPKQVLRGLAGKTIKRATQAGINVLKFEFDDDSEIEFEVESACPPVGLYAIGMNSPPTVIEVVRATRRAR